MSQAQESDRNQDATPYKLEEARKRGSVARSSDAQSFTAMAAATVGLFALAETAIRGMSTLMAKGLVPKPHAFDAPNSAAVSIHASLVDAALVIAPLLFVIVIAVVLVGVLQTGGLIFSSTPITPDLERINPASGFKRLFSLKLIYEAFKSIFKLAALVLVASITISAAMPSLSQLMSVSSKSFLLTMLHAAASLSAKLCAVLGVFALVDILFSRWDYLRGLRMSRREQEDEHKHRDGDPRIKARLRELRQEVLKRTRAVSKVPSADVLITNPTHVAIALRYEHGVSLAPQVVAKGAGTVARQMRDLAFRARVPIVQSPALARALYKEVPQDSYLPERWYPQVAKILVWIQAAKAAQRNAHEAGAGVR